jgi:hypothetical protein
LNTACNVVFVPEAASSAYGKHPSVRWPIPALADALTLLDLPRLRAKAAMYHRRFDLLVLNAGGGNKDVPGIDHRADSVVRRG